MMGQGFGDALARQIAPWVVAILVLMFSLGALAMWGLPKLWAWFKPLIHALTA